MVVAVITYGSRADHNASFDNNYHVTWGNSHVASVNQGTELHLWMDKASGLFNTMHVYVCMFRCMHACMLLAFMHIISACMHIIITNTTIHMNLLKSI